MSSLVERHHLVEAGNMSVSDVHTLYLLSTAKLVLENTMLHARLLLFPGQQIDVQSLLALFTLKGKPYAGQAPPVPRASRLIKSARPGSKKPN